MAKLQAACGVLVRFGNVLLPMQGNVSNVETIANRLMANAPSQPTIERQWRILHDTQTSVFEIQDASVYESMRDKMSK